ncbi:ATP-dependent DNA helicase RecG [Flammeovirgaceae bacterium SG7u.111]|nr:ATP-dependent DNA helicase RecG [Flammeovirgaceae bacterium SG7u.132]WPO35130.1 ATP-dependent DNA helicase RecG [Flammeovirgaceae bacterium SG7u.111]
MSFFENKIEFLKGVGPKKADLLKTELGIFTYGDLLEHFPFRHEDRTRFYQISQITPDMPFVQIKGVVRNLEIVGGGRKQRLVAYFEDGTGQMELVWFQGANWVQRRIKAGSAYVIFGKPTRYGRTYTISHPEIEVLTQETDTAGGLEPVYHTTEKLKNKFMDSRAIAKLQKVLLKQAYQHIPESLPPEVLEKFHFISKQDAVAQAHFPRDPQSLSKAVARLKFEELFYVQLKMLWQKNQRSYAFPGQRFPSIPSITTFYHDHLPFDLTGAQKRVIKEIRQDMLSGKQMNRLLQGDVGSGKTIVAFICMLMAIDNGAQACMMAPTEILASQHFEGLKEYADLLGIKIAKLTGSSKKSERKVIHEELLNGELQIIVGTHALIEDVVDFKNLGLCVIDEQHRFGVAQRAKLWNKTSEAYPHILVMTATPIPRTLAMTLYGDLDVSVIDELPAGRKPIKTIHWFDSQRLRVLGFVKEQVNLGRQVYIVYPLIEESEKLDYKNLMDGYESVARAFPDFFVSIVHGKMKPKDKDFEMQRFVKGETNIMVATTVIEVGMNVPNASVMIIENAEKFGLSQLHQLRGRVGRGGEQSYCILMSGEKLSKDGKVRLQTMVRTTNGFEIADADLKLRGPGDLAGTQQSGIIDLKFTDLAQDSNVVKEARHTVEKLLEADSTLASPANSLVKKRLELFEKKATNWSRIS